MRDWGNPPNFQQDYGANYGDANYGDGLLNSHRFNYGDGLLNSHRFDASAISELSP